MSLETTAKIELQRQGEDAHTLRVSTGDVAWQSYEVALDDADVRELMRQAATALGDLYAAALLAALHLPDLAPLGGGPAAQELARLLCLDCGEKGHISCIGPDGKCYATHSPCPTGAPDAAALMPEQTEPES